MASRGGEAIEEDEPPYVEDGVGHADLCRGAGDPDGADEEVHLVLLHREDVFDAGADFGLDRIGAPVVSGIGRPGGFLRWMRLTKPFLAKNSSLAFER